MDSIIKRWAQIQPETPAVIFPKHNKSYSYAAIEEKTAFLCETLINCGIERGNIVIVILSNPEDLTLYLISLLRLGAMVLPVDPSLDRAKVHELIDFAEPAGILINENSRHPELFPEKSNYFKKFKMNCQTGETALYISGKLNTHSEESSILLPTSGTTGIPKIVQISSSSYVCNAVDVSRFLNIGCKDRFLSLTPLFYCHGFYNGILMPLTAGAGTVVIERFDTFVAAKFWDLVQKYSVSIVNIVPTMLDMIMKVQYPKTALPESLRFFICGTSRLREEQKAAFEGKFGVSIYPQYGITESLINAINVRQDKADSQGQPVGCKITVKDSDGKILPCRSVGEISIQGVSVTKGYYKNPELTGAVLHGDCFRSGDLGFIDEENFLYVVGRVRELINKGGVKIFPEEINSVFRLHPSVEDVATIGITDDVYGEDVYTFIVVLKGHETTIQQLFSFARERLPKDKVPKEIIILEGGFPKGPTGKPRIPELRRIAIEKSTAL